MASVTDLSAMPRRELQALAKAHGLKANAKSDELAAQLLPLLLAGAGVSVPVAAPAPAAAVAQPAVPSAAPAEEEEGAEDVAGITRKLEDAFALADSPVVGLLGVGRRRGAAVVSATPFAFGAPRATLTPPDQAPSSGGSLGSRGWLSRARESLTALVADWAVQSSSPRRPSLLRSTLTATLGSGDKAKTTAVPAEPAAAPAAAPSRPAPSAAAANAAQRRATLGPQRARASLAPKPLITKPARHSLAPVAARPVQRGVVGVPSRLGPVAAFAPGKPPAAEKAPLRPGQVAPANLAALPWKPKVGPLPGRDPKPKPPVKFDLKASLQKPLTWQPKSGALAPKPAPPARLAAPSVPPPQQRRPLSPLPQPTAAAATMAARRASMMAAKAGQPSAVASAAKKRNARAAYTQAARRATLAAARARP